MIFSESAFAGTPVPPPRDGQGSGLNPTDGGLLDGAAPVPCCTFVAAWSSLSRKCRKPAFEERPASAW
ncbi:hypothetical protein CXT88_11580 [Akkermansia muciniphila]|nr:hypothetical protein CXT88_11580 [Akkermansia muciniphila]